MLGFLNVATAGWCAAFAYHYFMDGDILGAWLCVTFAILNVASAVLVKP